MGNVKIIHLFAFFSLCTCAFTGCASGNSADAEPGVDQTIAGATKWGHYNGEPITKWNSDGRTMTLLTELRYTDPEKGKSGLRQSVHWSMEHPFRVTSGQ